MLNRRQFLAASASALVTAAAKSRAEDMATSNPYTADIAEIEKAFPDASQLPPLLRQFSAWLMDKPWKSVGAFSLSPQWVDPQFAGSEHVYKDFALFIWLPDGSTAGYWLKGGSVAEAPIVLLGSEGEREVLAPSLESFLARVALGDFSDKGPGADFLYYDDDFEEEDVPDMRGQLQALLRRETGIEDLAALAAKAGGRRTDFAAWVDQAETIARSELAKDPAMQALSEILAKYRPVNAKSWDRTLIRVNWAGDDFEALLMQQGPKPLAEAELLRPHLAALRDGAAKRTPGLGLWNHAPLMVYADMIEFRPYYDHQPEFVTRQPSADAYKADQIRLPREARRIPPWLAKMLAT